MRGRGLGDAIELLAPIDLRHDSHEVDAAAQSCLLDNETLCKNRLLMRRRSPPCNGFDSNLILASPTALLVHVLYIEKVLQGDCYLK